jgi:hypothetical protein
VYNENSLFKTFKFEWGTPLLVASKKRTCTCGKLSMLIKWDHMGYLKAGPVLILFVHILILKTLSLDLAAFGAKIASLFASICLRWFHCLHPFVSLRPEEPYLFQLLSYYV